MSIQIHTNGHISIDSKDTGLGVTQGENGTIVFVREGLGRTYKQISMPHARYSLAHDKPASGNPGRAQFEADLLDALSG